MEKGVSGATPLYVQDNFLYYYSDNYLFRIDYTGNAENYHAFLEGQEEFDAIQILKIEWNGLNIILLKIDFINLIYFF